jgi:putative hydrolase of the HAD superfamily
MIRGVFFDAGNTIVFPDYGIYQGIANSFGLDVSIDHVVEAEALARSAFDRAVAERSDEGVQGYWPVYYTPFYLHLGVPAGEVPLAIEMTQEANDAGLGIWRVPVDGFDRTMDALSGRDLALGIVSNSDGRLEDRLGEIGIRDRFDFVIDSMIVGVSKPDPTIFLMALDAASLPSSEVVYVGDYYAVDVVGARTVGITPVLFDPYGVYEDVDCAVMNKFDDILGLVEDWTDNR